MTKYLISFPCRFYVGLTSFATYGWVGLLPLILVIPVISGGSVFVQMLVDGDL